RDHGRERSIDATRSGNAVQGEGVFRCERAVLYDAHEERGLIGSGFFIEHGEIEFEHLLLGTSGLYELEPIPHRPTRI
ncbi:hypothetical protein RZS08_05065, partial [Arthrospira platensis SPKY1]|nr:hypothetical protein [Arthrospira platensis SPKY1]